MPTNDFKPFATGAGANVMSQADWMALAALATGFQSGKASSAQVNKAIRQALFISSALAQYTADKSGLDVLDDGNIAGFIAKMSTAFGKDFQPLDATLTTLAALTTAANKLPYFTGPDAAALTDFTDVGRSVIGQTSVANLLSYLGLGDVVTRSDDWYKRALQNIYNLADLTDKAGARGNLGLGDSATKNTGTTAGTVAAGNDSRLVNALNKTFNLADLTDITGARNNLGLGSAAERTVGTGVGQIPDMSSWETTNSLNGYMKLPNGIYIQWYTVNLVSGANTVNFPVPFPNFFLADAGMPGISSVVGGVSATKTTRVYQSNSANQSCFIAVGL